MIKYCSIKTDMKKRIEKYHFEDLTYTFRDILLITNKKTERYEL